MPCGVPGVEFRVGLRLKAGDFGILAFDKCGVHGF